MNEVIRNSTLTGTLLSALPNVARGGETGKVVERQSRHTVYAPPQNQRAAARLPFDIDARRAGLRCRALRRLRLLRRAGILAPRLFVAVDELDHRHRGVVAEAEAGLEHAAIAAAALLVARSEHLEELLDHGVVAQLRHGDATGMKVAALAERDQLLDHRTQILRLGQGGDDLLVLYEGCRHVGEHRQAMLGGAVEPPAPETVTHGSLLCFTAAVPRAGRCLLCPLSRLLERAGLRERGACPHPVACGDSTSPASGRGVSQ